MFGVHNQIQDPAYKGRFKVIKTETSAHQIIYSLKIKGKGSFVVNKYKEAPFRAHVQCADLHSKILDARPLQV